MLSASSIRTFHQSTLKSTVFLERRLRAHLVTRDRLLYDSRFAPPAKQPSPYVHLYASLAGTFDVANGPKHAGPIAYLLTETEFDRVQPGSRTFRSFGEPCTIVELRMEAADVPRAAGLVHGPIELPPPVWAAYEALAAAPDEAALHQLVARLGEAQLISRGLTESVVTEEPERYQRLWTVIRPLYQDLATSASLKQIATLAGLSLRQLGRDLGDLTRDFGLFGAGFRDAMRVLRLRAATLLLSAPGGTPSDVARAVGYGSLDAMGRAFRDAQLPAPSIVQDAVRYRPPTPAAAS